MQEERKSDSVMTNEICKCHRGWRIVAKNELGQD